MLTDPVSYIRYALPLRDGDMCCRGPLSAGKQGTHESSREGTPRTD